MTVSASTLEHVQVVPSGGDLSVLLTPCTALAPAPGSQVACFDAFTPTQARLDGVQDARETLTRHGDARGALLALLDAAWDARNAADVDEAAWDYWAGHMQVYRDRLGISPERDVDRRVAVLHSA